MVRRNSFEMKGITIHYDKDIFGNYYLAGHYTTKVAPDSNVARRKFFRPYARYLNKLDRNNNHG
jgi:hypothetical protein